MINNYFTETFQKALSTQIPGTDKALSEDDFQRIADGETIDSIENITALTDYTNTSFLTFAFALTLVFILLAAIPRYSFRLSFLNDVLLRRIIFFIGLIFTTYVAITMHSSFYNALLQNQTCTDIFNPGDDTAVYKEIFEPFISLYFYISLAIYPVLFWLVAFVFNTLLHRRKLNTIFRSNNKVFGLI
jgi:hypothetical protein